ncbi:phage tail tube protein [Clostridium sp. J1101437_171009_A5]|uniref:phage tail tube protein n=1 Tax=Clostridium sp. J1101437_171009_A5 TaxID=2787098 RepID=UPI00189C5348|nr:phage tail tube protein [Clostridium sp. J1101437_171009_A5]
MSFLLERDTVNGAEGTVYITRKGKQIEVIGLKNIQPVGGIQSTDMRSIGTRVIQDKPNGVKLTAKGKVYYGSNGSNLFQEMLLNYITKGVMEYFDVQINNTDPTVSMGSQIMAYYGCHLTGEIPLSILDDEKAMLDYEFNFAYTRVARIQGFTDPVNVSQ